MLKVTFTLLALAGAVMLAGCASTGGSTITLSSVSATFAGATGPDYGQTSDAAYRVYPGDEANGNPEQGDSLYQSRAGLKPRRRHRRILQR